MFATFNSTPDTSKLVYYYARVYLYTFISMFIYVILSLFIALIMDSYEFIKKCYEEGWPKQRMHEYYKVRNYDPLSGIFRCA